MLATLFKATLALGLAVVLAACPARHEADTPSDTAAAPTEATAPSTLPDIDADATVATVNDAVIKGADLQRHLAPLASRFARTGQEVPTDKMLEFRQMVLDKLVEQELLFQAAKAADLSMDDETVEKEFEQMKSRFPSEAELASAFERMQITPEQMKEQMRRTMTIEQLIEKQVASKIDISEADMKTYYDKHPERFSKPASMRASHILIKVDDANDEAELAKARTTLAQAQKRLADGEDFAKIAGELSQCPSAAKGGDLGNFSTGQMVPAFEKAALSLEAGETSDIVQTNFGLHLIRLAEKSEAGKVSLEEASERLEPMLKQQKVQEALESYIAKLREDAEIKLSL